MRAWRDGPRRAWRNSARRAGASSSSTPSAQRCTTPPSASGTTGPRHRTFYPASPSSSVLPMRAGWRLAAPARWMGRQVLEGRGGQEEKLSRAMRELLEREAAFEALNAEACARARVRACGRLRMRLRAQTPARVHACAAQGPTSATLVKLWPETGQKQISGGRPA